MMIRELLPSITKRLHAETANLEAQILLAGVMGKSRTWLAAHPEKNLTGAQLASVEAAISRLEAGEPLPYVLGRWEFFGLDFFVTPDVLIPRPETELLVERAIQWLKELPSRSKLADVGTGSGCIAISIAKNIPDVKVIATDISISALEVARRNVRKHGVEKSCELIQCNLLPSRPEQRFNLICANLPYIPTKTLHGLDVFQREPTMALDGGADGLDLVRQLLELAPKWLAPNGMILLEIEASQGMAAVSLAYDSFDSAEIHLHKDLAGKDRLLEIKL